MLRDNTTIQRTRLPKLLLTANSAIPCLTAVLHPRTHRAFDGKHSRLCFARLRTARALDKWSSKGRFSGLQRRADTAQQQQRQAGAATTRVKAARKKPGRAGSLAVSRGKGDFGEYPVHLSEN